MSLSCAPSSGRPRSSKTRWRSCATSEDRSPATVVPISCCVSFPSPDCAAPCIASSVSTPSSRSSPLTASAVRRQRALLPADQAGWSSSRASPFSPQVSAPREAGAPGTRVWRRQAGRPSFRAAAPMRSRRLPPPSSPRASGSSRRAPTSSSTATACASRRHFAVGRQPAAVPRLHPSRPAEPERTTKPVGILFHTSESDIWPLEGPFNENLRDSRQRLLRYVRASSASTTT